MALVTVHRSPTPISISDTSTKYSEAFGTKDAVLKSHFSLSETYLTVKGAALVLSPSDCPRFAIDSQPAHNAARDIQQHLQCMYELLRPHDIIKLCVRLETANPLTAAANTCRYMTIVSTPGYQHTEESTILGVDIVDGKATIGLVLPVWNDLDIHLDGDGGFSLSSNNFQHVFKPVSVQAMWSALQTVISVRDFARAHNYLVEGQSHKWSLFYESQISSCLAAITDWHEMEDIESHRSTRLEHNASENIHLQRQIRNKLKDIMMTVDLEEVTSKYLRTRLEDEFKMSLCEFRHFIDEEMITIMRQMDSPSQIFDYLYLGSEWNASNLDELKINGVGYILNVTREIDNFFPGLFEYCNIRVYDVEDCDLLKHWHRTYQFITKARDNDSKVLVHCKMGISRSASTVIAYAMKEYGWSLEDAYQHVKHRRNCIKPNAGFIQQLTTYQGILDASKQRHSQLWTSTSSRSLIDKNNLSVLLDNSYTPCHQQNSSATDFSLTSQENAVACADVWQLCDNCESRNDAQLPVYCCFNSSDDDNDDDDVNNDDTLSEDLYQVNWQTLDDGDDDDDEEETETFVHKNTKQECFQVLVQDEPQHDNESVVTAATHLLTPTRVRCDHFWIKHPMQLSLQATSDISQPAFELTSDVAQPALESTSDVAQPSLKLTSDIAPPALELSSGIAQPALEPSSGTAQQALGPTFDLPEPTSNSGSAEPYFEPTIFEPTMTAVMPKLTASASSRLSRPIDLVIVQQTANLSALECTRSQSIYDTEEIHLEPGIVRRTRQQIEQRDRSSSLADIVVSHSTPMHRSASFRSPRFKSRDLCHVVPDECDSPQISAELEVRNTVEVEEHISSVTRDLVDQVSIETTRPFCAVRHHRNKTEQKSVSLKHCISDSQVLCATSDCKLTTSHHGAISDELSVAVHSNFSVLNGDKSVFMRSSLCRQTYPQTNSVYCRCKSTAAHIGSCLPVAVLRGEAPARDTSITSSDCSVSESRDHKNGTVKSCTTGLEQQQQSCQHAALVHQLVVTDWTPTMNTDTDWTPSGLARTPCSCTVGSTVQTDASVNQLMTTVVTKTRKLYGKTHPLAFLSRSCSSNNSHCD